MERTPETQTTSHSFDQSSVTVAHDRSHRKSYKTFCAVFPGSGTSGGHCGGHLSGWALAGTNTMVRGTQRGVNLKSQCAWAGVGGRALVNVFGFRVTSSAMAINRDTVFNFPITKTFNRVQLWRLGRAARGRRTFVIFHAMQPGSCRILAAAEGSAPAVGHFTFPVGA